MKEITVLQRYPLPVYNSHYEIRARYPLHFICDFASGPSPNLHKILQPRCSYLNLCRFFPTILNILHSHALTLHTFDWMTLRFISLYVLKNTFSSKFLHLYCHGCCVCIRRISLLDQQHPNRPQGLLCAVHGSGQAQHTVFSSRIF